MKKINNKFTEFKSGFVAIVGASNVGKSTLLNRMIGEKISITSRKPQTTRNRIIGILHRPSSQIVFIDTPGVHRAKGALNIRIVDVAFSALADVDIILIVLDVTNSNPESENILVKRLRKQKISAILALNKIDLIRKTELLTLIDKWTKTYPFESIIPASAKHGIMVEEIIRTMENLLPNGPPFFPKDTITDMPERFIAAEMIREKLFRLTGKEVPYSIAVTIDAFTEEVKEHLVKIYATIHVERDSQKGIIIGKSGSKLKKIGEEARREIQGMVGTKVFLKLFVRVQKNWSKDTKALRKFGY